MTTNENHNADVTDTLDISLTPEQVKSLGGVVKDEPKQTESASEAPATPEAPKEDVKAEEGSEAKKADEGVVAPKSAASEIFDLDQEKEKLEQKQAAQPLSQDERARLQDLEVQVKKHTEMSAFEAVMDTYSDKEIEILAPTIAKIIKSKEYDNLDKFEPRKRALMVVNLAKEAHTKELQEIREASDNAKIEQAKKEVTSRKVVKEVADIHSEGSTEESPKQKRQRLEKALEKGDAGAFSELFISEEDIALVKKAARR